MTAAPTEVDVSVVIPFRNAAPHVGEQLEALARQEFAGTWEVIAVDNGSTDESRRLAESFSDRLNLHIVDASERVGPGWAANVGARRASGRKLIFVDADDEVTPGYLSAMAAALDEHEFIMSAFDHETLNPEWVRSAVGDFVRDPDDPLAAHFGVLPSAGASVGITRAAFDEAGGYPEDFPRMQDIAMSWEVQFGGRPLHYVPDAVYRVRHRQTVRELFHQSFAGASCAPLLYKRYRPAGMRRRAIAQLLRSWARLVVRLVRARTKAEVAAVAVQLGRELGRLNGSIRHRVFFP